MGSSKGSSSGPFADGIISRPSRFEPAMAPDPDAVAHRYIHVVESRVWVHDRIADDSWNRHFLGHLDGQAYWGIDVPRHDDPSDGAALDLFSFFGRASEDEWLIAGRAVQLVDWARTHRFCGRCGTATESARGERAMKCPACGLVAFPRLAPAMITLVTRGEPGPDQEALLARGVQFRAPMFSCLAGFVEPGETLEGAVVREVREEVGVAVHNVRYLGSQPWPFPHSLMLGFRADWHSGDIVCDPNEILEANWYRKDDLPPIPPGISIARKLIDHWLQES
ncbi:MAG: NAD(+) diphosphatase [Actinomycetota bacterium]